MWPFRRKKGKHRRTPGAELEKKLTAVTKEHEQRSVAVTVKANRLGVAADRLIESNERALRNSATQG